jgi:hypothetical protein
MARAPENGRYFDLSSDIPNPFVERPYRKVSHELNQARRFYALRFDSTRYSRSFRSLTQFIEENREDALKHGVRVQPSVRALFRDIKMLAQSQAKVVASKLDVRPGESNVER